MVIPQDDNFISSIKTLLATPEPYTVSEATLWFKLKSKPGSISLDQMVVLFNQCVSFLEDMSPGDGARDKFVRDAATLQELAFRYYLRTSVPRMTGNFGDLTLSVMGQGILDDVVEILDAYQIGYSTFAYFEHPPTTLVIPDLRNKSIDEPEVKDVIATLASMEKPRMGPTDRSKCLTARLVYGPLYLP